MSHKARKWLNVHEHTPDGGAILMATGDAELDAHFRRELYSKATGARPMLMLYDSDATVVGNIPVRTGLGTADSNVNHAALIQYLYERGAVPNAETPLYVCMDWETDFYYPWLEGYDTLENEAKSRDRQLAAAAAARAEFGTGVLWGSWGSPLIHYAAYRDADTAGKAAIVAAAKARWAPLLTEMDFLLPRCNQYWPTTDAMDPATREYQVNCTGPYVTGIELAQHDVLWNEGMEVIRRGIDVCLEIQAESSRAIEIMPSISGYYSISPTLCFRDSEGYQFVPNRQVLRALVDELRRDGVTGYNWFLPIEYYMSLVFTASPGTNILRNAVVRTYYNGVSPVPDTHPTWNTPALIVDFAVRHNTRMIALNRYIQDALAGRRLTPVPNGFRRRRHSDRPAR